jgi:hypothetical protein
MISFCEEAHFDKNECMGWYCMTVLSFGCNEYCNNITFLEHKNKKIWILITFFMLKNLNEVPLPIVSIPL